MQSWCGMVICLAKSLVAVTGEAGGTDGGGNYGTCHRSFFLKCEGCGFKLHPYLLAVRCWSRHGTSLTSSTIRSVKLAYCSQHGVNRRRNAVFSTIAVTVTPVPVSTFGLHSLTSVRVRSAGLHLVRGSPAPFISFPGTQ